MKKLAVLSIIVLSFSCSDATKAAKKEVPASAPTEAAIEVPSDQLAAIQEVRDALASIASKSPGAKLLLAYYDQHAVAALSTGTGVKVARPLKEQGDFFVALRPNLVADQTKTGFILAEFVCHPTPVMTVRNPAISKLAKAIMLAHELTHALDCLQLGEPPSSPMSETWLIGELHGYSASIAVLKEISDGRWDALVESVRTRSAKNAEAAGTPPENVYFDGVDQESIDALQATFGPMDYTNLSVITTQMIIAMNLEHIRFYDGRLGRNEVEIGAHMTHYIKFFFERNR